MPRSAGTSAMTVKAVHVPTGFFVQGEVLPGNRDRGEQRQVRREVESILASLIACEVARLERRPGRAPAKPAPVPRYLVITTGFLRPKEHESLLACYGMVPAISKGNRRTSR